MKIEPDIKTLVLTGGACAGKSSGLVRIRERLSNLGWHPIIVPEAATLIFQGAGRPDISDRKRIFEYQRTILQTQLSLEKHFRSLAQHPKSIILTDRGALDSKAYMTPDEWQALLSDLNLNEVQLRDRNYDAVIHLVTAANGAPEAYKLEGVRNETPQEAIEQDRRLQLAYLGHGHHKIIDNSTDFNTKLCRIEQEICHILGLPEPLEIERRFLLPTAPKLPVPCVTSQIEQTYLISSGDQRRLRKRTQDGTATYTLGTKRHISEGTRVEKEATLQGSEYVSLMAEKDPACETISKKRHCFIHNNRCMELDEYVGKLAGLWVLEVEVEDIKAPISLPPWAVGAREITSDNRFSNAMLSRHGRPPILEIQ